MLNMPTSSAGITTNSSAARYQCCHSIKCRTILWHMVFWGFVINYIFCINLNITIVDMVVIKTEQQQQQHTQQLISEITNTTTEVSTTAIETEFNDDDFQKLEWDQYQQGLI
ncbi:hypothetical protein FF38_04719 [Lucilia cuprina]|uniref:Uncharacterized protein n=1 Tax=Lucilia cuprina TaxID=7375 RepID=A0A0L0CLL9_LUCCU|nr:hypothetical protein FF38_04719 [Lucilia cuprina]